jgi:hypothetical protein
MTAAKDRASALPPLIRHAFSAITGEGHSIASRFLEAASVVSSFVMSQGRLLPRVDEKRTGQGEILSVRT